VRRGWTTPYKYLSERKQRSMLIDAKVEERVIYSGKAEWPAFVRALRPNDDVVVADLRIFGSRKALGDAAAEIEERGCYLESVAVQTQMHYDTLKAVQRVESQWAGERSMGGSKRARELSARGIAAYRAKIESSRIPKDKAEAIWRDVERYPNRADALKAMPGWKLMAAWRSFGAREK
jgi:hypothetical protein